MRCPRLARPRTVIATAIGILMERYRIGDEQAFAVLARNSQSTTSSSDVWQRIAQHLSRAFRRKTRSNPTRIVAPRWTQFGPAGTPTPPRYEPARPCRAFHPSEELSDEPSGYASACCADLANTGTQIPSALRHRTPGFITRSLAHREAGSVCRGKHVHRRRNIFATRIGARLCGPSVSCAPAITRVA
jgi:hypothetical protein